MKTKQVLKSLADLSTEALKTETDKVTRGKAEPSRSDAKEKRENQLRITAPKNSGYPHWGINE
jgi:hypothetical protein